MEFSEGEATQPLMRRYNRLVSTLGFAVGVVMIYGFATLSKNSSLQLRRNAGTKSIQLWGLCFGSCSASTQPTQSEDEAIATLLAGTPQALLAVQTSATAEFQAAVKEYNRKVDAALAELQVSSDSIVAAAEAFALEFGSSEEVSEGSADSQGTAEAAEVPTAVVQQADTIRSSMRSNSSAASKKAESAINTLSASFQGEVSSIASSAQTKITNVVTTASAQETQTPLNVQMPGLLLTDQMVDASALQVFRDQATGIAEAVKIEALEEGFKAETEARAKWWNSLMAHQNTLISAVHIVEKAEHAPEEEEEE